MSFLNLKSFTLLVILAVGPGCAVHRVRVNAYLSHELDFPVPAGERPASIAVVVGSEPKEPLLEAEVARKVAHLVRQAGFKIGTPEDAGHILTTWVSIDEGYTETVIDTSYQGPAFSTNYVYTHPGHWGALTIGVGGGYAPHTYDYTYFVRFLGMTLYDRELWQGATEDTIGGAAVWTCNTMSRGSSSDLRSIANFLLVAAIDQFGEDTGRELRIKFKRDDPRVASLIAIGGGSERSEHAQTER